MNAAQLINQDSGDTEKYTPLEIVEAAREVMGDIDLDPASSKIANHGVRASSIFTIHDDGLSQRWFGRIWMNHPFQKGRNHLWINKLIAEYESGSVTEACCITFASTSEGWFQPLLERPQCFFRKRVNYLWPDGTVQKGVTKGSVVTYLGDNADRFRMVFRRFGVVKVAA